MGAISTDGKTDTWLIYDSENKSIMVFDSFGYVNIKSNSPKIFMEVLHNVTQIKISILRPRLYGRIALRLRAVRFGHAAPFTAPKKLDTYLYYMEYSDYVHDLITCEQVKTGFACSAVRNGNFYGRNLDLDFATTLAANYGKPRIHALVVVRYVLDHAKSAAHGVELLKNMDIYGGYGTWRGLHWMLSDEKETYIIYLLSGRHGTLQSMTLQTKLSA